MDNQIECKGDHIAKANCCVMRQKAIKKSRKEWWTWKEREGEHQNIVTEEQQIMDEIEGEVVLS